jgi:DNA-binding XRE family transcriptional regulator
MYRYKLEIISVDSNKPLVYDKVIEIESESPKLLDKVTEYLEFNAQTDTQDYQEFEVYGAEFRVISREEVTLLDRIVKYQSKHKLTDVDFAKLCGITRITIGNLKRGRNLSLPSQRKIENVLKGE